MSALDLQKINEIYTTYAKLDLRAENQTLTADSVLTGKDGLLDSMSIVGFLIELEDQSKLNLLDPAMDVLRKYGQLRVRDVMSLMGMNP